MNPKTHGMVVEADVLDCAIELHVNDIPVGRYIHPGQVLRIPTSDQLARL